MRERIFNAYAALRNNEEIHLLDHSNPVKRTPLAITGFEGELFITEIYSEDSNIAAEGEQPRPAVDMANGGASYDQFHALYSK